ncbi:MAG: DUF3300 domain-containing protein [Victivallales bacterium]|jgi:hypothetical protein
MRIFVLSLLFTALPLFLGAQDQQSVAAPAQKKFSGAQLEQLVAPIALYPDSLLAQVLAASTYPVDIVEAARWVKHNPDLSQDDFKNEIKNKTWDPSVKGLVFFPQLLAKMNDNLDWTTDLGNAFLSQQKDVMDTIQTMRAKAQDVGTLQANSNQIIGTTQDGDIQIQSVNPDTVYVQDYVPANAYGSSWTSDNSNGYYPEVIAAPAWPWGCYGGSWALGYYCGWRNGWIGYNNNYWNNNHFINPNKYGPNNLYDPRNQGDLANRQWRHDSANTRPLTQNTEQIARQLETEKRVPQNFRGVDNAASNELRQALNESPRGGEAARSLQNAERDGGGFQQENFDHAFSGSRDAGLDQAYSNRGYESRSISSGGGYHSGGYRGGGHGGGRR